MRKTIRQPPRHRKPLATVCPARLRGRPARSRNTIKIEGTNRATTTDTTTGNRNGQGRILDRLAPGPVPPLRSGLLQGATVAAAVVTRTRTRGSGKVQVISTTAEIVIVKRIATTRGDTKRAKKETDDEIDPCLEIGVDDFLFHSLYPGNAHILFSFWRTC